MSKRSCEAAESIEDASLRMARVNSNKFSGENIIHAPVEIEKSREYNEDRS